MTLRDIQENRRKHFKTVSWEAWKESGWPQLTPIRDVGYLSMSLTINTEVKSSRTNNIKGKGKVWWGDGAPPNLSGWAGFNIIFQQSNQTSSFDLKCKFSPTLTDTSASRVPGNYSWGSRSMLKLETDLSFLCLWSGDCLGLLGLTWMNKAPLWLVDSP